MKTGMWSTRAARELAAVASAEIRSAHGDELWAQLATDVLDALAAGDDPRCVIDGRKYDESTPVRVAREVQRAVYSGGVKSMAQAYEIAANALKISDVRELRRSWDTYWRDIAGNDVKFVPPWEFGRAPRTRRNKGGNQPN